MIRSALLVCAVIVMVASPACAPVEPTPGGGGVAVCTAASFVAKASYLAVPFTPAPGAGAPPTSPLPANYAQDLAAAFNIAPPAFQKRLCDLDAVYVNAAPCTSSAECQSASWGWRQSRPTIGQGRVVALSVGLWKLGSYSAYETDLTHSILPTAGVAYANAETCLPSGACQSDDNLPTALLAALAHETGHIRWFDLIGPLPDPTVFCGGGFFRYSWETPIHHLTLDEFGRRFRRLLTPEERRLLRLSNRWIDHHKNGQTRIDRIDNPRPGDPPVSQMIHDLLRPLSPWASLFAAMSPDEDFVETYKFKVLTTATPPLKSATITVPGAGSVNVAADYFSDKKPELLAKTVCIPESF